MTGLRSTFTALLALTACHPSAGTEDVQLLVAAEWKSDPGSVTEIGYWITVDVAWPGRGQTCTPPPTGLQVTVNQAQATPAPVLVGDCVWDARFQVGPFSSDPTVPIVVSVADGTTPVGTATYPPLFPGFAVTLLAPAGGNVRVGGNLDLTLSAPLPANANLLAGARYDWVNPPGSVPPFYVLTAATLGTDRQSIAVGVPELAGRAALTLRTSLERNILADACDGFTACTATPSATIGPVLVEIAP
jgi:hypothetical protein